MPRFPNTIFAAVMMLLAAVLAPLASRPAAAVDTTNVDYLAEMAIRQLAESWDSAQIAPLFAEAQRAELHSEPVRLAVRGMAALGTVKLVTEQFRTFSTMSQFGMGAGQTTRSYATRAYLVEYAGGGAKITVAMVGDGRHTDIQLINIRKLTPPPAIVTLGRPDMHVWSEFERW